jgi:transcriptional regulator with XRE-family HTH domain
MKLDLEKLKQAKKDKKLSYDDLAQLTGYCRSTITNIFLGYIEFPRHETIVALYNALEIPIEDEKNPPDRELSEGENQLIELIGELTDEEWEEIKDFIQYIKSKRK